MAALPTLLDQENLAREVGATAENGSRAEEVFCFTRSELTDYVERLQERVRGCVAKEQWAQERVDHQPAADRKATDSKSLMPDNSPLTMRLATQAFKLIDRNTFKVSASLSADNAESLRAFGILQTILLMAYREGYDSVMRRKTQRAEQGIGGELVAQHAKELSEAGMTQAAETLLELHSRLEHTDYWYGTRMARLFDWAHAELSEEQRTRYFSIVANGTADVMEPPTYAQQYNQMKWRLEQALEQVRRLTHPTQENKEVQAVATGKNPENPGSPEYRENPKRA